MNPLFRYDIVGSFLRPKSLKDARDDFFAGKIKKEELTAIEDKCIKELVEKQKSMNLPYITDGEFRREFWHLDFLENLTGVKRVGANEWSVKFKNVSPKATSITICDKLDFPDSHPFIEHFKFLTTLVDAKKAKITIPSPSMLHIIPCVRDVNYKPIDEYSKDENAIFKAIEDTYIKAINKFYSLGCRYLQLDDTSWGEFCDIQRRRAYESRGINLDKLENSYVDMINNIIAKKPKDMIITIHICRGNFRSNWFSSGGYEPVSKILFAKCKVDGFFLEYDTDRAGDFSPLSKIKDQMVVLGLITSKFPELENKKDVEKRIDEARKYVNDSQLAISTQCGFASTEEGNDLTQDEQWAKIKLVQEIAKEVWG